MKVNVKINLFSFALFSFGLGFRYKVMSLFTAFDVTVSAGERQFV